MNGWLAELRLLVRSQPKTGRWLHTKRARVIGPPNVPALLDYLENNLAVVAPRKEDCRMSTSLSWPTRRRAAELHWKVGAIQFTLGQSYGVRYECRTYRRPAIKA
jgi:hypothetical protein